jgi:ABC-type Mn2+/Zn2+ transport system permease subunit
MAIAGPALFAIVVDAESARVSGLPVNLLNGLLVALAAVTVARSSS